LKFTTQCTKRKKTLQRLHMLEQEKRCNSCIWFDREDKTCDHCAFGHPYVEQNGMKPSEVEKCDIYTYDEAVDYEWQWAVFNKMANRYYLTPYFSRPNEGRTGRWIKVNETRRKKI